MLDFLLEEPPTRRVDAEWLLILLGAGFSVAVSHSAAFIDRLDLASIDGLVAVVYPVVPLFKALADGSPRPSEAALFWTMQICLFPLWIGYLSYWPRLQLYSPRLLSINLRAVAPGWLLIAGGLLGYLLFVTPTPEQLMEGPRPLLFRATHSTSFRGVFAFVLVVGVVWSILVPLVALLQWKRRKKALDE